MPRSVLHTYSKKRATNDYNSNAFDKLIQDVSNNTIKKQKLSTNPSINDNKKGDENDYNIFNNIDEPIPKIKTTTTTTTAKKNADVVFKPTFFKSKKNIQKKAASKPLPTRTAKKAASLNFKQQQNTFDSNDDGDSSSENDNHNHQSDLNNKSTSSSIQSACSTIGSAAGCGGDNDNSFLDVHLKKLENIEVKELVKEEIKIETKTKSLFFTKSKSLNSCPKTKKSSFDSDSDEDKEFEKIINFKLKLTKSNSDTSSLLSSPASLNSSNNDKGSPLSSKLSAPKRIFSGNQTKKVSFNK
jgi:hypothetical protein